MTAIYPIPSGRSSGTLLARRMLSQLQAAENRLLRVEQQLTTGRRIQLSGEDPGAANRAVALQRLLELKEQFQVNASTSRSYLNATDTALAGVANLLADVRGTAVQAANNTLTDTERAALADRVQAAIDRMLTVGNSSFRGRYLFAGSSPSGQPFETLGDYVAYNGNDTVLRSPVGFGDLLDTNVPGQELFGAVSRDVQGIDLNPVLTPATRLSDLRGGQGIRSGTIVISDGVSSSSVSVSETMTVGDVARLLAANPPEGREVRVTINARGLRVEMDAAGGGSLIVRDVPGGSTAAELGIARMAGSASTPIEGSELDPVLRPTTPLADLLGARARAIVRSPGPHNDIVLEAREPGPAGNGTRLQLVDHDLLQAAPGLAAGNEFVEVHATAQPARAAIRLSGLNNDLILTANSGGRQWNNVQIAIDASTHLGNAANVTYDPATNTLTLHVDYSDETTAGTLAAAIDASGVFTAAGDSSLGDVFDPAATVLSMDAGVRGNTGNSGGDPNTVFVYIRAGESTAGQVVAALNASGDVNSRFFAFLDEQDTMSAALSGSRPVDVRGSAMTEGGTGSVWDQASGLRIANGNTTHVISFSGAETVEDLLGILNRSSAMVLAEVNAEQTGINVRSRLSGSDFAIGENGGTTATDLGLRSFTLDTRLDSLNHGGGVRVADGVDFTIRRNDGVELTVDVSAARTVGDVIQLINGHADNLDPVTAVVARLSVVGNGIELVDDNPVGAGTLTVLRATGSYAAWDLGLIPSGNDVSGPLSQPAAPATASIQFAAPHDVNTALRLVANETGTQWNGVSIEFQNSLVASATYDAMARRLVIEMVDGLTTANTVIAAVLAEGTFRAELDLSVDPTNNGSGTLVAPAGIAAVAQGGTPDVLTGEDAGALETEGVFNSLIRLKQAIASADFSEIQRLQTLLDADAERLSFGRAVVGARGQALDAIAARNEDEQVELKSVLSDEIEVDMAVAASDLAARQAAYEASLRTIATMFRLSLMDFI